MVEVFCARTPEQLADVRLMLHGLAMHFSMLGHEDIEPDAFDAEIEGPDALYDEPAGRILLARIEGVPVGCAMLRPLPDGTCEVRRVFVAPSARRRGVARAMMVRLMAEARGVGYGCIRLVTGEEFSSAIALYEGLGFRHILCYRSTVWTDVACMEAGLT
ncbi:MAG: GNAT family N-acetyltransferase [Coriobacteriia bacterium]|nr:GNAT family N-acetyltransferase [Coriobacteriia bacterium]